jgi:hypothetical protein
MIGRLTHQIGQHLIALYMLIVGGICGSAIVSYAPLWWVYVVSVCAPIGYCLGRLTSAHRQPGEPIGWKLFWSVLWFNVGLYAAFAWTLYRVVARINF